MGKKTQRDSGAPKRNVSAYLLYQNAMREQFKAINPGMTFGQLAKYTSAMYSELSPSEKEAWAARAEADKARYLHELASYVPPPGYDPKGDAIISPVNTKTGRKGKPEKDVNAPKRNLSAYLLYQNGMREHFKRENPGMTFGQLAKYTSHMYKNLTPEEKATWEGRAAQDKARYETEIAAYVPPPGHDARGVLIEDNRPRKRNKRGPKDPSAPKRASGAYVFFTNDMRPIVFQEYPGIKFVELGRVLGERWRALTPHQKKRYEGMAADDKVRFQMDMQQYTANQAAAVPPQPQPSAAADYFSYQDHPSQAPAGYEAYSQHHDPYAHSQYHAA
jgi:high mobility group protein B2